MKTILIIGLSLFFIINSGILFLGLQNHLDSNSIKWVYYVLYQRFFHKISILIRKGYKHPVLFIKLVFYKLFSILFSCFRIILYPGFVLSIGVLSITLTIVFYILSKLNVGILIYAIATIITTYIIILCSDYYTGKYEELIISIYKKNCYLSKYFSNLSKYTFAKLSGNDFFIKDDPSLYANEKVDAYRKISEEIDQKHQSKEPEVKSEHKINYLDVMYSSELKLFDFYMKDFTLEELKKKKRELLKIHHPDNFHDEFDISYHQKKCHEITCAYSILEKYFKKEA